MKVKTYKPVINKGVLEETSEEITIEPRRWVDNNGTSHPMNYLEPKAFKNKNVYFLHLFGDDSGNFHKGKHISLNFLNNQRFLWMQKSHPLQKPLIWLPIIISIVSLIISIVK